jgi:hypothetical protein
MSAIRLSVLAFAAAAMATGCAPERPDALPGTEGSDRMAVLSSDNQGTWDVLELDSMGNVVREIDANLSDASTLARHPDGFYLTSNWSDVLRIEDNGDVSIFNNDPLPSGVFRVTVDDDGDTTVAQEYDVTEIDDGGDIIAHTTVPSTYCWMDAAPGPDSNDDAALLDVFGPNLAVWDADANGFDVFASGLPGDVNILGQTGNGDYVAVSEWNDHITLATADGDVENLGRLSDNGIQAWAIHAVEAGSGDNALALIEGNDGSSIVRVSDAGDMQQVVVSEGQVWRDLVTF